VTDEASLPSIEIRGIRLHAETFGSPGNPVLVVLHGGPGGDYRSLLGLKKLADQYRVIFYNQRGVGLSQRVPADQLNFSGYLEDLDWIVDYYGKGNPVRIIGHSCGAMLLSAYLGYAPEKEMKAVMAEPGFLNMEEMRVWRSLRRPGLALWNRRVKGRK
jgi:proline iminopeptidase